MRAHPDQDPLLIIDNLCERLVVSWQTGRPIRIEELLEESPETLRNQALVDLIAEELNQRVRAGEKPKFSDYHARFNTRLDAAFRGYRSYDPLATQPFELGDHFESKGLSQFHEQAVDGLDVEKRTELEGKFEKPAEPAVAATAPKNIGRYEIVLILGEGGFGRVYKAWDPSLKRFVAIKVWKEKFASQVGCMERLLEEAMVAADLDHNGLVRVWDAQQENNQPYIVQQFIDAVNLKEFVRSRTLSCAQIIALMIEVVDAVKYLHQKRVVHRDLKPTNILVDEQGHAHLVDFGLAVRADTQWQRAGEVAGTWRYMSPEQVRGETHLLDGRSDLWSIGVILYELFVGESPFPATNHSDLLDQIRTLDPRPLRQLLPSLPIELENICSKCLQRRRSDRYTSATDLKEDLNHFLAQIRSADSKFVEGAGTEKPTKSDTSNHGSGTTILDAVRVNPKGLRSFDQRDAEFFLELLPGSRDRHGLPDSIRFWKTQIEETDPDKTFNVGLIYGPSGCGKTSLMKAGILPRLDISIVAIYVEATADDTEVRLLKALKKRFPQVTEGLSLPETLQRLREQGIGGGRKLLIVLDQFEQWLHTKWNDDSPQLIDALRQCDSGNLQCIAMVRDDFWMPATQFMEAVESKLVEGFNSNCVDRFPIRHAVEVLSKFGRAHRCLPEKVSEQTEAQSDFVQQSVLGLSENGRVACVRLSLFFDMMKEKPWTPLSLKDVGGPEGVGVMFLEETFSNSTAPPTHRLHQKAARAILKALLPRVGSNIKGNMRSRDELLECSGYAEHPRAFAEVMQLLNSELRLITPTDPEGAATDLDSSGLHDSSLQYFQLTHDYLVPSVRLWLDQLERATPAGRAKLRLLALADNYQESKDQRFLPTIFEFLEIARFVGLSKCEGVARIVYLKALRKHAVRAALVAIILFLGMGSWYELRKRELRLRTDGQVALWLKSQDASAFGMLETEADKPSFIAALQRRGLRSDLIETEQLGLDLGLALFTRVDSDTIHRLVNSVYSVDPKTQLPLLRRAFSKNRETSIKLLKQKCLDLKNVVSGASKQSEELTEEKRYLLEEERQQHDGSAAKLAIVLLHLGEYQPFVTCLEIVPNEFRRQMTIHWLGEDTDAINDYFDFFDQSKVEHDVLAGVVKGLGRRDWRREEGRTRDRWISKLKGLFEGSESGSMHSATEYALRKLNEKLPTEYFQTNKDWAVAKCGLTFVRIPAKGKKLGVKQRSIGNASEISEMEEQMADFWMSTTEMPSELQTLNEWDANPKSIPLTNVNIIAAMRICNRLSIYEGRNPCYVESSESISLESVTKAKFDFDKVKTQIAGMKEWLYDSSADGFRIPSPAELLFAACAESETTLPLSPRVARLLAVENCWYDENSNGSIQPMGQKLPNDFGLFDITGNATEFALDTRSGKVPLGHFYMLTGADSPIDDVQKPPVYPTQIWKAKENWSFRVVCSRKPSD